MITKTAYLSYLHCAKRFWLEEHEPLRAEEPDAVIRRRMREGTKVGRLADELLEYCRLDTLAMVEMHKVLAGLE